MPSPAMLTSALRLSHSLHSAESRCDGLEIGVRCVTLQYACLSRSESVVWASATTQELASSRTRISWRISA